VTDHDLKADSRALLHGGNAALLNELEGLGARVTVRNADGVTQVTFSGPAAAVEAAESRIRAAAAEAEAARLAQYQQQMLEQQQATFASQQQHQLQHQQQQQEYQGHAMGGGGAPGYGQPPSAVDTSNHVSLNIDIPPEKVGLVIGRGGENIRRMQEQSQCKIFLHKEVQASGARLVTVSGPPENIEQARKMVLDSVSAQRQPREGGFVPPPGTPSLLVIVPNAIIGLLIGKGGVTIKEIQQQSGCRVVIDKEPQGEDRNITLVGSVPGIEYCKNAIQDIINRHAELAARNAGGPPHMGGGGGMPRPPPQHMPYAPQPPMGQGYPPQGYPPQGYPPQQAYYPPQQPGAYPPPPAGQWPAQPYPPQGYPGYQDHAAYDQQQQQQWAAYQQQMQQQQQQPPQPPHQ
jgi:rRNA processing protein Krr1/Pno1